MVDWKGGQFVVKVIIVSLLGSILLTGQKEEKFVKQPFMVYDSPCILSLEKKKTTTLVAPMIKGQPDLNHLKLTDVLTTYDPLCGHIEIRTTSTQ